MTAAVLLALAAGCGSSGGDDSSSGQTTPASVLPTGETTSGQNPNALATVFPQSKGGGSVTKAKVPATPLGAQTQKVVLLAAPRESSGSSTGTGPVVGEAHLPAGSFAVVNNPCSGRTLQPDSPCAIEIAFAPTSVGTQSAELTVDTSAADADYRVELTGEGVEPTTPVPTVKSPTPEITTPVQSASAEATES